MQQANALLQRLSGVLVIKDSFGKCTWVNLSLGSINTMVGMHDACDPWLLGAVRGANVSMWVTHVEL